MVASIENIRGNRLELGEEQELATWFLDVCTSEPYYLGEAHRYSLTNRSLYGGKMSLNGTAVSEIAILPLRVKCHNRWYAEAEADIVLLTGEGEFNWATLQGSQAGVKLWLREGGMSEAQMRQIVRNLALSPGSTPMHPLREAEVNFPMLFLKKHHTPWLTDSPDQAEAKSETKVVPGEQVFEYSAILTDSLQEWQKLQAEKPLLAGVILASAIEYCLTRQGIDDQLGYLISSAWGSSGREEQLFSLSRFWLHFGLSRAMFQDKTRIPEPLVQWLSRVWQEVNAREDQLLEEKEKKRISLEQSTRNWRVWHKAINWLGTGAILASVLAAWSSYRSPGVAPALVGAYASQFQLVISLFGLNAAASRLWGRHQDRYRQEMAELGDKLDELYEDCREFSEIYPVLFELRAELTQALTVLNQSELLSVLEEGTPYDVSAANQRSSRQEIFHKP